MTCCGLLNFEQHCVSKKHLRRAAGAAEEALQLRASPPALSPAPPPGALLPAQDGAPGTTYVGLQAHCRNYCNQVIPPSPLSALTGCLSNQYLVPGCVHGRCRLLGTGLGMLQ